MILAKNEWKMKRTAFLSKNLQPYNFIIRKSTVRTAEVAIV